MQGWREEEESYDGEEGEDCCKDRKDERDDYLAGDVGTWERVTRGWGGIGGGFVPKFVDEVREDPNENETKRELEEAEDPGESFGGGGDHSGRLARREYLGCAKVIKRYWFVRFVGC